MKHRYLLSADYITACVLLMTAMSNKELTVYKYEDLYLRGANIERHRMMRQKILKIEFIKSHKNIWKVVRKPVKIRYLNDDDDNDTQR